MYKNLPTRLRAPLRVLAAGAVVVAVAVSVHGWGSPVFLVLIPFVLLAAVGYYLWGGGDGDLAAAVRHENDERQERRRLRVQALVGRVMSLAVVAACLVAYGLGAPLWPFAVALALPVLATAAGWLLYRDGVGPAGR